MCLGIVSLSKDSEKDKPEKSEHRIQNKEICEIYCLIAVIAEAQAIVMAQWHDKFMIAINSIPENLCDIY